MMDVSTGGRVVGESIGGVVGVVTSVAFEIGVVTMPVELSPGGVVMVGPSVVVSVPFVAGGRTTLVGSTGGRVLVGTSVDSVALVTGGGTITTEDGLVGSGVKEDATDGEEVSVGAVVSTVVGVSTEEGVSTVVGVLTVVGVSMGVGVSTVVGVSAGVVRTTEGDDSTEDMGTEGEGEGSVKVTEGEEGSNEEMESTTEEDPITGIPVPEGILVKEKEIPMSVGDGSGVPVGDGSSVGTTTDPASVEVGVVSVPFCEGRTAEVTSDAMLLTTELISPRRSVVVVGVG
jgi:hypothetical protein